MIAISHGAGENQPLFELSSASSCFSGVINHTPQSTNPQLLDTRQSPYHDIWDILANQEDSRCLAFFSLLLWPFACYRTVMSPPNGHFWTQFSCKTDLFNCHLILLGDNIAHLSFSDTAHGRALLFLRQHRQTTQPLPAHSHLARQLHTTLAAYAAGRSTSLPAPFLASPFWTGGTPWQRKVWDAIRRIPYGATRIYGELAAIIGNPNAARAVGQACHANPLALLVPCHRVVAAHGLGGFAGEIGIKQRLLELEQAHSGNSRR